MSYIENPKMRGSGLLACIPQEGRCPNNCQDCFFQSGRSYLEPLDENLPNMPPQAEAAGRVVRVNDGNDSNVQRNWVQDGVRQYPMRFYNTAIPKHLVRFDAPIVLTVNPGEKTDIGAVLLWPPPRNLMFVRIRTNTWNLEAVVRGAIEHYAACGIPIVLTFMAYFDGQIPTGHETNYTFRKRTLNSYWAITTAAWEEVMHPWRHNKWVYSCGKIEGELGTTACRHCGNCLREYFATMERLRTAP